MPARKGLLAPQNTFLDTIATRFDGTRKFLAFWPAVDGVAANALGHWRIFMAYTYTITYTKEHIVQIVRLVKKVVCKTDTIS